MTTAASRLAAALQQEEDLTDHQNTTDVESDEVDIGETTEETVEGYCVECRDQLYTLRCLGCEGDKFCEVCFMHIHRHGSRKRHETEKCVSPLSMSESSQPETDAQPGPTSQPDVDEEECSVNDVEMEEKIPQTLPLLPGTDASIRERSKFVPLRLTYEERRMLRLVEATLNVSEYTDKVDVIGVGGSKMRRIQQQLKSVYAVLCGLVVAEDYSAGQALIASSDISSHANFFANAFEIARRYKIMNPDKMRDHYGKLLFLLQDSRIPEIAELFGFDPVIPVRTVYTLLESRGERALALLDDPLIPIATRTITAEGKTRMQIDREIKQKERAIEELARRYAFGSEETLPKRRYWYSYFAYGDDSDDDEANRPINPDVLTREEVRRALYSLGDANTFLVENRDPVDKMMGLLHRFFHSSGPIMDPEHPAYKLLLGIQSGYEGSRLTHSHSTQFAFVNQTLSMWKHVLNDFYRLWILSEEDFLDPRNPARFRDTGQGYNRVQACPRISNAMRKILHVCHLECESTGGWVGSSVVHLGDRNVPNALVFIDKYTQVSRILSPLTTVISSIPTIFKDNPELRQYLQSTFGSEDRLRAIILSDFFRHAFNGSGADNNFDAGSCVDGRLTSAWEWCSKIDKKIYSPVFKLSNVLGFDGRWER